MNSTQTLPTFTNPRTSATIEDYPIGGSRRGTATFEVEHDAKRGDRVARVTTGKPKRTTYDTVMCIVDGDDDRTYILGYAAEWGQLHVIGGTMKQVANFHIDIGDEPERKIARELLEIIKARVTG